MYSVHVTMYLYMCIHGSMVNVPVYMAAADLLHHLHALY